MNTIQLVKEFHTKFKRKTYKYPEIEDHRLNKFRVNLLQEELDELKIALHEGILTDVLDALLDIQYVLDGAFIALGLSDYKHIGFEEVHRSNMTKQQVNGNDDGYGKIQKGPDYSPPDLDRIIADKFGEF